MKHVVLFAVVYLCTIMCAYSQSPSRFFRTNTNAGTEFYFSFPPCYIDMGSENNNIHLYISSSTTAEVTVEVKSMGWIKKKTTIPNDVIEILIDKTVAQPYSKFYVDPSSPDTVYPGKAIHISATAPIIVYGMTRFQYTSDGFLALPVAALGTEYIVASYADAFDNQTLFMPSETVITAPFDSTKVTFVMGGNLVSRTNGQGKGNNGLIPGQSKSFTLMKGDVYSFSSFGNESDLSGSKIIATKPISVVSGNYCADIPTDVVACDFIDEMELPTNTWGMAYHITSIFGRQKHQYMKVFAKESNTKIFLDGKQIGIIATSGGTSGKGFIERRVSDGLQKSHIISADKPISVTTFNPGQSDDGVPSDPFQMILTPVEQFQTEIMFNTPGIKGGIGFAVNYVNVVYELDVNGEVPNDLEFATINNGIPSWNSVKAQFGSSIGEQFAFPINGITYAMKTIKLPGDGVYKVRAKRPLAAYAYGFSNYDSYGYPASATLNTTESSDSLAPVPLFTVQKNGSIMDGSVKDFPANKTVRSNLARLIMVPEASSNYVFTPSTFIPGQDSVTSWKLNVVDATKSAEATLVFLDRAGNDTTIIIKYEGSLGITASGYDFGKVSLGTYQEGTAVLTNSSNQDIIVTGMDEPQNSDFVVNPINFPYTLKSGAQLVATIRFQPTTQKIYTDRIIFYSTSIPSGLTVSFTGEGIGPDIITYDWDFGQVPVGVTSKKVLTVSNSGKGNLVLESVTTPLSSAFTTDLSAFPYTIKPGEALNYMVYFTPEAEQHYSDEIIFHSNASGPDPVAHLSGNGLPPVGVKEMIENVPLNMHSEPNPSYGETIVTYHLPVAVPVRLSLVNTLGEEVKVLAEEYESAGDQRIKFQASAIPAGIYLLRLNAGGRTEIQTLTIIK